LRGLAHEDRRAGWGESPASQARKGAYIGCTHAGLGGVTGRPKKSIPPAPKLVDDLAIVEARNVGLTRGRASPPQLGFW